MVWSDYLSQICDTTPVWTERMQVKESEEETILSMMSDLKGISIQQYKTDVGFRTPVEGVNENLYIIPKYQRKYRWSKEQIIALVEYYIGYYLDRKKVIP